MKLLPEKFLHSETFEFRVGSPPTVFHVHRDLITLESKKLESLMNGSTHGSPNKLVELPMATSSTFTRFGQYLYSGWYNDAAWFSMSKLSRLNLNAAQASEKPWPTPSSWQTQSPWHTGTPWLAWKEIDGKVPLAVGEKAPVTIQEKTESEENNLSTLDDSSLSDSAHSQLAESLWDKFSAKQYWYPPNAPTQRGFLPRANKDAREDYTEVFLCHAKLYVFADTYDIYSLKKLALYRLHQALRVFTLYNERTNDILALLKYCYASKTEESDVADLCDLVATYVACFIEKMTDNPNFCKFLQCGGPVVMTILKLSITRINEDVTWTENPTKREEVAKEAVDDCDGNGNGKDEAVPVTT